MDLLSKQLNYKDAMLVLKRGERASLKRLLSTTKAFQVVALLQSYVKAYQDTDKAEEAFVVYMEQWYETSTDEDLEQLWAGRRKLEDTWDAAVRVEQDILASITAIAGDSE